MPRRGRLTKHKAALVENLKGARMKRHPNQESWKSTVQSSSTTPPHLDQQLSSPIEPQIQHQQKEVPCISGAKRYENANLTPRSKQRISSLVPSANPTGRRLFTISAVQSAMNWAAKHGNNCTNPDLKVVRERRSGLESSVCVTCSTCHRRPVWLHNDIGDKTLPGNEAAAWAANSTGVGYNGLKHTLTALDIPCLSFNSFRKQELQFANVLSQTLIKQLQQNGEEEIRLAKEKNQLIRTPSGDIPWTAVFCDGQWSKRCYNQQGTALSGSAAIIGLLTKKPLFVAVRNKFCYTCHINNKKSITVPDHVCFKNFGGSSSAMEASIIEEGFKLSVQQHGLVYKTLIGDGDSNVLLTVQNIYNKIEYGHTIVNKVECKNHAIRRMNYNLHQLTLNKMFPLEDRSALTLRMPTIGRCCKYAIEIRSETSDVKALRRDLLNVLKHAFGDHANCSSDLCQNGVQVVPQRYRHADFQPPRVDPAEKKKNLVPVLCNKPIWKSAVDIIERLANLSSSLVLNFTSNIVESFQSSVCKMIEGKRTNLILRGGYTRRVHAATMSFHHGAGWYAEAYKLALGRSPGSLWKRRYAEGSRARLTARARSKARNPRRALVRDKPTDEHFSKTRRPQGSKFYGPHASTPEVEEDELTVLTQDLEKALQISSVAEQDRVLRETLGQFENDRYRLRRQQMITASACGRIYSLQDHTSNRGMLDTILGPEVNSEAIRWGKCHEPDGVNLYAKLQNCEVRPSGLFVSLENGVLGASPDGLIGTEGILEVKCPFSARRYDKTEDVIKCCSFLTLSSGGLPQLKQSHNYYRQVVMQLHVTKRKWCDFVVWTQGPALSEDGKNPLTPGGHILVTRIHRNDATSQLWQLMQSKLLKFWRHDLAPELKDSRFDRNMGYRQPEYRLQAKKAHESRRNKRKTQLSTGKPSARKKLRFEDDSIQDTINHVIQQARKYRTRQDKANTTEEKSQKESNLESQPKSSSGTRLRFIPPPARDDSDAD